VCSKGVFSSFACASIEKRLQVIVGQCVIVFSLAVRTQLFCWAWRRPAAALAATQAKRIVPSFVVATLVELVQAVIRHRIGVFSCAVLAVRDRWGTTDVATWQALVLLLAHCATSPVDAIMAVMAFGARDAEPVIAEGKVSVAIRVASTLLNVIAMPEIADRPFSIAFGVAFALGRLECGQSNVSVLSCHDRSAPGEVFG